MTRLKHQIKPGDGDPRHGTTNGYNNYKCRCLPCTVARAAADAERKRRARSKAATR